MTKKRYYFKLYDLDEQEEYNIIYISATGLNELEAFNKIEKEEYYQQHHETISIDILDD